MKISPDKVKAELQERFVQLLRELTDKGKVEWAQEDKPGHVHCMAGEEYITFEVLGADVGHVRPDHDKIAYVAGYCRNVTYFWVPTLREWNMLLELLRQAPIDEGRFGRFRRVTQDLPTRVLERIIEHDTGAD